MEESSLSVQMMLARSAIYCGGNGPARQNIHGRRADPGRLRPTTSEFGRLVLSYIKAIDRGFVRNVATATLSAKYQISIPKEVRDAQRWHAGQEFVFVPKGKGVLVIPVPTFDELKGMAKGADPEDIRDRKDLY
jgi:AbrB family looped-hinge helix DNA binding protein